MSVSTLGRYQELDTIAEEGLRELSELGAEALGVSRFLIALLDPAGEWIETIIGVEPGTTSRYVAFCLYVLHQGALVSARDVRELPAFASDPSVKGEGGLRFFAGLTLRHADGARLGVLCVLDELPRELDDRTRSLLTRLARRIENQVELQRRLVAVRDKHFEHIGALQMLTGLLGAATTFAIMGTDPSGRITTFSEGAERMLGVRAAEVVGRSSLLAFLSAAELDARARELPRSLGSRISGFEILSAPCRGGAPEEREWTMLRPGPTASAGATFPASLVIGPVIGEGREITGYVAIARDISERKAIERMKDDFLSTVSHELRTPLTSILGSLGLVMGGVAGALPAEASSLLAIAHSNSERLLSLVNDILDVQKLESGLFELRVATCDLRKIVDRAVELTAPFVQGHGVTLVVSADPGPILASADFDRLVQVLVNLLSNAAKFSPQGETVTVSLERLAGRARITVSDRGAGIPEAFQAKIFSKFMQASTGDASRRGGTGLGLSIVKSIVELHGGKVSFQTTPGLGTSFFVEVPT